MNTNTPLAEKLKNRHTELIAAIQPLLQRWRESDDGQLTWLKADLLQTEHRLLYDVSTLINKWYQPIKPYRYRPLIDPDRWALLHVMLVLLTPDINIANSHDEIDDNACFVTKVACLGGDVGWYMHLPPYQHNQSELWDHCIYCGKPLRCISEIKTY